MPEGVQVAADHVVSGSNHAGDLLAGAWHTACGVSIDPSKAYCLAIKAVETAAKPHASPNDGSVTLGKVKNVLRDQKWGLPLTNQDDNGAVLRGIVGALWAGQTDRHGSGGPLVKPTQEAAETAVMLAVPLVQWFTSAPVARLPRPVGMSGPETYPFALGASRGQISGLREGISPLGQVQRDRTSVRPSPAALTAFRKDATAPAKRLTDLAALADRAAQRLPSCEHVRGTRPSSAPSPGNGPTRVT